MPVTRHEPPASDVRPISHQSTNQKVFTLATARMTASSRVLDVGAGEGYFAMLLGEHCRREYGVSPQTMVTACVVTPSIFRYRVIACDALGDDGRLPYADDSFDLVCSLEVVEHVQNQFLYCREILRVLKPGGTAILSTPNILNMNSRYRMLHSGFATLFNPLSRSSVDVVHTSGHIHPIGYYYLSYALHHAGASDVSVTFDRFKRSSLLPLLLFLPILLVGHAAFRLTLRRKDAIRFSENERFISQMQSWNMLTSRSIIVLART